MSEISAIVVNGDRIESISGVLSNCGIKTRVFDNLDTWVDVSSSSLKTTAAQSTPEKPEGDAAQEQCLLLVGPLGEIAERQLPKKINEVHPGLPVVVAGNSPSRQEIVQVVRQGAVDVIDLNQPEEVCRTVSTAIDLGRQTQSQRLRVIELRERLSNLTVAEQQVLDAMLNGYANKETAKLLGIGLRTVELRRAKIMMKMGAKGVAELVKFFCEARCPGVDTKAIQGGV